MGVFGKIGILLHICIGYYVLTKISSVQHSFVLHHIYIPIYVHKKYIIVYYYCLVCTIYLIYFTTYLSR